MDDPSRSITSSRTSQSYRDALQRIAAQASDLIRAKPWLRITIGKLLWLNLALGCVVAVWAVSIRERNLAAERTRQQQCSYNLSVIALALRNYHNAYGSFPPAHVDDANGKPMHSWRVLILPFLGRSDLYGMYNFNEPWDSPGNRALLASMPKAYACPSESTSMAGRGLTSYVAVTGPGTVFPDGAAVSIAALKNGGSSTVIATEADNMRVGWTEPRDLDVRTMSLDVTDPRRAHASNRHPGAVGMAFADGETVWIDEAKTP